MIEDITCAVCGKTFVSASDLDKHVLAFHSSGEELAELQPELSGEQSTSGSAPDPESDDDTLENAHQLGQQLEEDEEHPKELNLGSDIDKAEQHIRTH